VLQQQRELQLRTRKDGTVHTIRWVRNRTENIVAILMQVTAGTVAESPCTSCFRGNGPFTSCVVSDFSSLGSCANCYYTGKRWACSFRADKAAERAALIAALAEAIPPAEPAQLAEPAAQLVQPAQPAQPVASPTQLDEPFVLPREIPEGMPYLDKRATARWLRHMADTYDQSAEDDVHHEYP
jgi:hypothetical protein